MGTARLCDSHFSQDIRRGRGGISYCALLTPGGGAQMNTTLLFFKILDAAELRVNTLTVINSNKLDNK